MIFGAFLAAQLGEGAALNALAFDEDRTAWAFDATVRAMLTLVVIIVIFEVIEAFRSA